MNMRPAVVFSISLFRKPRRKFAYGSSAVPVVAKATGQVGKLTFCVEEVIMKVEVARGIAVVVVAVAVAGATNVLVYDVEVLVLVKVKVRVEV
jgi:hypothetical protein